MKKAFVFSIIAIFIIIIFNQTTHAQSEPVSTKIWLITSNDYGCSTKNYEAILFLQSIALAYFTLYGVETQFSPPQCLYLSNLENSKKQLSNSMKNFDLPIIILDSQVSSNQFFTSEQDHHFQLRGHLAPHAVFCYCSIPSISHTSTWALSHQLSHFILNHLGESKFVSVNWVHDIDKEAIDCVVSRGHEGLCKTRWTPAFGIVPKEMMTVKVYPDYFREIDSIQQMTLSKTDALYSKPFEVSSTNWINQIELWYNNELISKTEFENFLRYLSNYNITDNLDTQLNYLATGNEKTILKLNPFNKIEGGNPIVFSGSLSTISGLKIENEKIFIKTSGGCPTDGIIAQGKTDKNGKFLIKKISMDWNKNDNRMKLSAEFFGNDKLAPSSSRTYEVLTNISNGQNCYFIEGIS